VLPSERRDGAAARAICTRAIRFGPGPVEVTTDRAPVHPRVINELAPGAPQVLEQYANNRIEADHARLKARLPPMRGLTRMRSAATIAAGHASVQNLRRGHYDLTADVARHDRVRVAFAELASCL
jgi:IS6 family transposase